MLQTCSPECAVDNSEVQYYPLGTTERYHQDQVWELAKKKIAERRIRDEEGNKFSFSPCIHPVPQNCGSSLATNRYHDPLVRVKDGSQKFAPPVFDRLTQRTHLARKPNGCVPTDAGQSTTTKNPLKTATTAVEDRLLQYGERVALKLAEKRHQKEKATLSISQTSNSHQRREEQNDFLVRNTLLLEKRKFHCYEAEKNRLRECTFHPKINNQSAVLDGSRRDKERKSSPPSQCSVFGLSSCSSNSQQDGIVDSSFTTPREKVQKERSTLLYEEAFRRRETEEEYYQHHHYDFVPRTNPLSEEWIDRSKHYHSLFQKNFLERQELYQKESDYHKSLLEAERFENSVSQLRVPEDKAQRKQYCTALEEQVERLYKGAANFSGTNSQNSDVQTTSSFHPQIAPGSKLVIQKMKDREADVVKRLTQGSQKQSVNETVAEEPRPNSSATCISKEEVEDFYRRQMNALQLKDFRVAEERKKEEVRSVLECTFRPAISPRVSLSFTEESLSSRVTGVSKFLERQAEAKRIQKEKDEREKQIGGGKPVNGPNHTLFTPFELETENRVREKKKIYISSTSSAHLKDPSERSRRKESNYVEMSCPSIHRNTEVTAASECPTLSLFSTKMNP